MNERSFARRSACVLLGLLLTPWLRAADQPRLVTQTGHSQATYAAALSADGRWVLTGSLDNVAVLWDANTGQELRRLVGHPSFIFLVALSPDGRRALTGGQDGSARVWDVNTGKVLQTFPSDGVRLLSAAFSANGRWVLIRGESGASRLWDAATGKKVRDLPSASDFSPDGRNVLTGDKDGAVRLLDAETGKEVRAFKGHTGAVGSVAFSPDGKRVLSVGGDKTTRLWDAGSGKELHRFSFGHAALSPDGRRLLTADKEGGTKLWDADTGKELRRFEGFINLWQSPVAGVGGALAVPAPFSPDGRRVLTASKDRKTARLWDADTGKELRQFAGHTDVIMTMAFSPDGRRLLTSGGDSTARLWDTATGKELICLRRQVLPVLSSLFSRDGSRLLLRAGGTASVWELATGKELRRFQGSPNWEDPGWISTASLSPDGKRVVLGTKDNVARVWDVGSGKELCQFKGHTAPIMSLGFAPDGRWVLSAGLDATARLWGAATGEEVRRLTHPNSVLSAAFSPDGRQLRTTTDGQNNPLNLWDAASGKELPRLEQTKRFATALLSPDGRWVTGATEDRQKLLLWEFGSNRPAQALDCPFPPIGVLSRSVSPDGRRALTGENDGRTRLWDLQKGGFVTLPGHTDRVHTAIFSPDGRHALTGSSDGTARLWDVVTGKERCRLILFEDGTWAVVDPGGRYDASNGGDVKGLHWVVGNETVALSQLKERYYDPGLLAKYLGFSKEPPRDVAAFRDVKMYPAVAVAQKDARKPQLDVTLTNRGGGIGRVVVLVNGKELTEDARPRGGADADAAKLDFPLDLANDPRLRPGQKNKVEVLAYNGEGYLCSRGMVREFDGPGPAAAAPTHLYAVVVGVSKYRGGKLDLRYAAKDAEDFAAALELAAKRLFDAEKVHLTLLTAAKEETRPTRAAIDKALGALKATKPGDIVVVYLAGHGVTQGGQDGEWHYLSADAQSADLADPEVRKQVSLSSAELTDLLKAAPAQKQVLILDTCHSGRLVEKLTEKRDVPGSQARALERVKDRTGMHVLAGCAADSVSYEASRYGQGLLTYSLLLAMRGAKLREGEYVDVAELFGYAADKVPELARDVGGVQRPLIASPRGASFDVGRLTAADRANVPLQQVRPVVVRTVFQLEKPARDPLGLTKRVNDRLREASSAPRGARLVFVDAEEFPDGVQVSGRYKVDGDKVTVSVTPFAGDRELPGFVVEGAADKPDELAEKVVAEVEKRLDPR